MPKWTGCVTCPHPFKHHEQKLPKLEKIQPQLHLTWVNWQQIKYLGVFCELSVADSMKLDI